jgi:hypothetical protein
MMTRIKKFPGMIYFSEIIPNLYVGGVEEAKIAIDRGDFEVIDVRCIRTDESQDFIDAKVLDGFVWIIGEFLLSGRKVFVHCQEGIERSPLVIAWYLATYHRKEYPDLESAYRHVIDKHPITQRRGSWVLWKERDDRGMFGKNR